MIIDEIIRRLEAAYPDALCSLDFRDPLELLICTQLAAQCTDARVNLVAPALFERYPDARAFAAAKQEELEEIIKSTGFFRNKARNIIACCQRICAVYGGNVPDNMENLLTLAGVGRKTANLVLGDAFGQPAIVVDTHCKRISRRLGLTSNEDPEKIETDLRAIIPPEKGNDFCHRLVLHGRAVCSARKPKCAVCQLKDLCPSNGKC